MTARQIDLFDDTAVADRRGFAPPIRGRFAADSIALSPRLPKRLQRTRRRNRRTPKGAVYVGFPTVWANPFAGRHRIGHKRSVILHWLWLRGECSPRILRLCGFSAAEAATLERWRLRVLKRLPELRGRDLQCWCPTTSGWCHADTLLRLASDAETVAAELDRVEHHGVRA